MYLTGYHGTNKVAAKNIIREASFKKSIGEKHWLGDGIYFYEKNEDALDWNYDGESGSETVLHCIIVVEETAYIDFDTKEGLEILREAKRVLLQMAASDHYFEKRVFSSSEMNQCHMMNLIWQSHPEISVMAASFSVGRRKISTLLDERRKRREICARDNDWIQSIIEIKVRK